MTPPRTSSRDERGSGAPRRDEYVPSLRAVLRDVPKIPAPPAVCSIVLRVRRRRVPEADQPGRRCGEPAGVQAERLQAWLEIDDDPFASRSLRFHYRAFDDLRAQAAALMCRAGLGVDEERMIAAVLRDVDEAHQLTGWNSSRDPPQRMPTNTTPPTTFGSTSVGLGELDDLLIGHGCSPLDCDTCAGHRARVHPVRVISNPFAGFPRAPDDDLVIAVGRREFLSEAPMATGPPHPLRG